MNVLSLFDGMSCGRIALERAGINVQNYYASEIDKHAIKVSKANWPCITHIGDVTKVSYKDGVLYTENGEFNVGKIDLLIGGSPCQSFSTAGKQEGFNGKSSLFYEWLRIFNEINPRYFLLENVKMKRDWMDKISGLVGVESIEINSGLVSVQQRKRLYWTNIKFNEIQDKSIVLSDVFKIFPAVNIRLKVPLQINPCKKAGGTQPYYQDRVFHYSGKTHCLTTFGSGVFVGDYAKSTWIRLTPEQHEILMTIPTGYTASAPKSARYKMLGNGWTVDVIAHILRGLVQ